MMYLIVIVEMLSCMVQVGIKGFCKVLIRSLLDYLE